MNYQRRPQIVNAQPMSEDSFLLESQSHRIDGARKMGYRPGFKVVDGEAVSWMEREEFLKEFVEVSG